MPMKVTVTVNNKIIEEMELTRLQALGNDDEDYTYKVAYRRRTAHRTFNMDTPKAVYIPHDFRAGSLVLIRNAINAVLDKSITRRLP